MERSLGRSDLHPDPIEQLRRWLGDAEAAGVLQPSAMTLATVSADGRPSARVVLLRGLDERGLVWHTNRESRKGRELLDMPTAAVVFHWDVLERQVRMEGPVEAIGEDESAAYFGGRPRGHQLAAWASPQSEPVESRDRLEQAFQRLDSEYPDEVPLPPFWGGYRLKPDRGEFWQGRRDRLHDRFEYLAGPDGWRVRRLAP